MVDAGIAGLTSGYSGPHELFRASDGKVLFVRRWNPESKPIVSVLIFHGSWGPQEILKTQAFQGRSHHQNLERAFVLMGRRSAAAKA